MHDDAFSAFLAEPSATNFLRLRGHVLAAPDYDFASDAVTELETLVAQRRFDDVPAKLAELMPGWLLSPRAHRLAGQAAEEAGNSERAAFEAEFARACLGGLLRSGAGTRERPYLVSHVADEYDLLEALHKAPAAQRPVRGDDGVFDVIACSDGTELWFDLSARGTGA